MKRKSSVFLFFCLTLILLTCSACGHTEIVRSTEAETTPLSETSLPAQETSSSEVVLTTEETMSPESSSAEPEETETAEGMQAGEELVFDVNNLSPEQRDMISFLDVAAYTGIRADDLWGPLYFLCCTTKYDDFLVDEKSLAFFSDYHLTVPKTTVLELASVFCADFDGILPPLSQDSVSDLRSDSYQDGELYYFAQGDMGEDGDYLFHITSWVQHSDGTCTVEGVRDFYYDYDTTATEHPTAERTYRYELVENEYTKTYANPLFVYSIRSMEEIDGYLLPDSDRRYYEKSDLKSWDQESLRTARNEIYARHGYIFESADLQDYFGELSWYRGTIPGAEFDYSTLNAYEKANIETIKSLEKGSFSFAEIKDKEFCFASGVGAWATVLTVSSDGSFEGNYHDSDAGQRAYCDFTGTFSKPTRINEYTYSSAVASLKYLSAVGTEEMIDDILYIYTDPYGICEGDEVRIYLPGMRLMDLPDVVLGWSMNLDKDDLTEDMILEKYVIWDMDDDGGGVFWHGS